MIVVAALVAIYIAISHKLLILGLAGLVYLYYHTGVKAPVLKTA